MIKRVMVNLLMILISVSIVFTPTLPGLMQEAYADEDSVVPVLNEFKVVNTPAARPGVVQIQLDITEEDSGFSDFGLSLSWTKNGTPQSGSISTGLEYGGAVGDMCSNFQLSIDQNGKQFGEYSGLYTFNLYIGKNANVSDYTITRLWIRDKYGNTKEYGNEALSKIAFDGKIGFSISGDSSGDDFIAPVLNSFKIMDTSISRPGTVKIQLDVFEEGDGFSDFDLSLRWTKNGTPQSGSISTGLEYGGAAGDMCSNFQISLNKNSKQFGENSGLYTFDLYIGEKANISEYTITGLWIRDKGGNETRYTEKDLPILASNGSSTFSVFGNSVTDDVVAPVLNSYEILNPIVNRPGVLKLKINITEEGSGFSDIELALSWTKNGIRQSGSVSTGLEYGGAAGDMCSNFDFWNNNNSQNFGGKSGTYIFTLLIGEKADLSTYSIDRIWLRDKYGNTVEVGSWSGDDNKNIINYSTNGTNTFVLKDEFDYYFASGTNNPDLSKKLSLMPVGKAAKVEITGNKVLSKACLDAIKGQDKTIVAYSNNVQWIIHGEQLTGTTKDLNLGVTVSSIKNGDYFADDGNSDDSWTISEDSVRLDFYPNGVLPGTIQVRFKSDTLYDRGIAGSVLALYYYDGSNLILEDSDSDLNFDGTDKWCYVSVTHNSKFAVSNTKSLKLKKKTNTDISKASASGIVSKTYTGKAVTQKPVVKVNGKTLKAGTDYKLSYKNNKNVGEAICTITGRGIYKGAINKKFKIIPIGSSISKVKKGKKSFLVTWKKQTKQTTGYQIQYSQKKSFKSAKIVTIKSNKKTKITVKKLKAKKKYYVRVRTYKTVKGKKYFSSWSKMKTVVPRK